MIYVTGDMHGDLSRLRTKAARRLKKNDYLIICGDFGFVWDGSQREKRILNWLGRRRYHILFIEGTHDNLDLINSYPVTPWKGGLVHEISGKVRHLIRGSVFTLDGEKVFVFGGGESKDADLRPDNMWWHEELPTSEDLEAARENLSRHDNEVDYIITHQTSRRIKQFLSMFDTEFNILDIYFDELRETCKYSRWFFASYHVNKIIPPSDHSVFTSIIQASRQNRKH